MQSIQYFGDPFKLVPINDIAEIADKLTRNEVVTSNEMRAIIGLKPSKNPKADQLINSNMPQPQPLQDQPEQPAESNVVPIQTASKAVNH
jgi:hypothetical protein